MTVDATTVRRHVDRFWSDQVLDTLVEFVAIPDVSAAFDADWEANGHIDRAMDLVEGWCRRHDLPGASITVQRRPGRSPLLVIDVPATRPDLANDTVLLYGHLDKQPEMDGWRSGLGPWTPVIDGDLLYGRGGADDGYAVFATVSAILALRSAGGDHARLLVLIEASEESGSIDLPDHLDALGDRLGDVSLVIGLDSGAGDYERLWMTTSLRGVLVASVRVDVLTEGVHSGSAGGVVPSSFRLLRRLLDRIEDPDTGRVLVPELWGPIPAEREAQLADSADTVSAELAFPIPPGASPLQRDAVAALRARTWEPAIATIAMDGFPPSDRAGNVLRPWTEATLACRLSPTADPAAAAAALTRALESDPPAGCTVTVEIRGAEGGWNAPATEPWLAEIVDRASLDQWGRAAGWLGEGGTIPFMGMLGQRFPDAQFVITGVLGPGSNAHGPNEFLHLPMARAISAAVAQVIDAHARR